jgi:HEPN domain-containing protein
VHDLIELLGTVEGACAVPDDVREACVFLNPFYIDTRYPVTWPTDYSRSTAEQALRACAVVAGWVDHLLARPHLPKGSE